MPRNELCDSTQVPREGLFRRTILTLAVGAWAVAVIGGFAVLMAYKTTPGEGAEAPSSWPDETALTLARRAPTLVMFVHPHCDCSRASVAELERMMARARGQVTGQVVFIRPEGTPSGWERTSLRDAVQRIPGVTLIDDVGGVEARRFGAIASGTTVLYDRSGELLFAGGITSMRGHEGESAGQARILALLTRGRADRADAPVFGCELGDSEPVAQAGQR